MTAKHALRLVIDIESRARSIQKRRGLVHDWYMIIKNYTEIRNQVSIARVDTRLPRTDIFLIYKTAIV